MNEYIPPKYKWVDGVLVVDFESQTVPMDNNDNTVEFPYYEWPNFQWPCQCGSCQEQTMEIEIDGKTVIITGKELKVKVLEVK